MYKDFIQDAIESADNYYTSADKMKHSRVDIRVTGIKKIASDLYQLSLSQRLKHSESACLCIESHLIAPNLYDDLSNRFISPSYFKILSVGDDIATATLEIKDDLLAVFDRLCADDIKLVSDLKFLITNVKKWYSQYGHFIHCPSSPALSENDFFWQGTESDQQKDAVRTALTQNISYVWGAPGTGKTQIVLADCILSYIKAGKQVLVLAPTNNAIEQTLRAIIRALEEQGESISCLYRLGTSSESFARQHGMICEKIDQQTKIEDLKKSIEILEEKLKKMEKAKSFLQAYKEFCIHVAAYREHTAHIQALSEKIDEHKKRLSLIADDIPSFQKTLADLHDRKRAIEKREASFFFMIKSLFTKSEATALKEEAELLTVRVSAITAKIAELQNETDAIQKTIEQATVQKKQIEEISRSSYTIAKNIAKINVSSTFLSLDLIEPQFVSLAEKFASQSADNNIEEKIKEKKELLRELLGNVSKKLEGKLVFSFTVDYFFAHYKSLAEVGINSALVSHIFLDEAAYCPLIKSGILYSLGAPVTLLGDHMQLPPICEASDRATNDPATKLFLWDMSAIYLPETFDHSASFDTLFARYQKLKSKAQRDVDQLSALSDENLSIAVLPYTFRFGHNLAQLLDEFVYKTGFSGRKDFDTDITVIHGQRHSNEDDLRTSIGEAVAIRRYILEHTPKNYTVMTPYKKQRALLMDTLRGITNPDDILTIHASQGREWDTVILSVADSRSPFLVNSNLPQGLHALNTAISRAKKNIVIACDKDYWLHHADNQLIGKMAEIATHIF